MKKEAREARLEVLQKAARDLAQACLDLCRQFLIVVFLREDGLLKGWERRNDNKPQLAKRIA